MNKEEKSRVLAFIILVLIIGIALAAGAGNHTLALFFLIFLSSAGSKVETDQLKERIEELENNG